MLDVDEVAGIADGVEFRAADQLAELAGFVGRGVDVQLAVHEQHRDLDAGEALGIAIGVQAQHFADMEVHLVVFVLVQAADVAEVVALEQLWQVAADGFVDQVADLGAIAGGEVVEAAMQVVEHGRVELRRE